MCGLLITDRLASGYDPEGCRVMRCRKPLRHTVVVLAWLGLFAALLLVLNKLPGTLHGAAPTAVSSRTRTEVTFDYGDQCSLLLNSGGWVQVPYVRCESSTRSVATCGPNHANSWQWGPQGRQCGAARLNTLQARHVLQQKWIVMAGDSITRFLFAALLRLLADDDEQIVFGHRDFEYTLPGNIRASFIWAPYTANITSRITQWTHGSEQPDYIIISTGLWHMLHVGDPEGYKSAILQLGNLSDGLVNKQRCDVQMHFLSITEVFPPKLKTDEKKQALTLQRVDEYNQCILDSHMLLPAGPFGLVDMHHLTRGCGPDCTHDGLHYSNTTYDAALQIWANSLQLD